MSSWDLVRARHFRAPYDPNLLGSVVDEAFVHSTVLRSFVWASRTWLPTEWLTSGLEQSSFVRRTAVSIPGTYKLRVAHAQKDQLEGNYLGAYFV